MNNSIEPSSGLHCFLLHYSLWAHENKALNEDCLWCLESENRWQKLPVPFFGVLNEIGRWKYDDCNDWNQIFWNYQIFHFVLHYFSFPSFSLFLFFLSRIEYWMTRLTKFCYLPSCSQTASSSRYINFELKLEYN